eukprot:361260-Chlamydomonas_euryale.AAC.5
MDGEGGGEGGGTGAWRWGEARGRRPSPVAPQGASPKRCCRRCLRPAALRARASPPGGGNAKRRQWMCGGWLEGGWRGGKGGVGEVLRAHTSPGGDECEERREGRGLARATEPLLSPSPHTNS